MSWTAPSFQTPGIPLCKVQHSHSTGLSFSPEASTHGPPFGQADLPDPQSFLRKCLGLHEGLSANRLDLFFESDRDTPPSVEVYLGTLLTFPEQLLLRQSFCRSLG